MALDPLTTILNIGSQIIDKIYPDKTEAEKQKTRLIEIATTNDLARLGHEVSLLLGQIEINKIEAASTKWWVAGWRPFIGWICGFSLFYSFVFQPLLLFIVLSYGKTMTLPPLEMSALMTILLGMLGLGMMRSYDKGKIVDNK